jgi:hypothetical protein
MIRTDASGMRKYFPSNHFVAKQYNDPVSGIVYGNICLEEIQFSWNEDSLGPLASGRKRKYSRLPNVCHGTRAVGDRILAARLDSMQADSMEANTDILDDGSGSLHGSIPYSSR